jgi:hypothetical protein
MKLSFSLIADCVFCFICCFLVCFVILNFYIPRQFSISFSSVLSLLFSVIIAKRLISKDRLTKEQKELISQKEKMVTQFNFATRCEVNDFFESVLKKLNYKTERKKGGIFIKDKSVALFPLFGFNQTGKSQIVKVFNSISRGELAYILSETFSDDAFSFAERFDGAITLVKPDEIFSFLKKHDSLPPEKYQVVKKKRKRFSALKNLTLKKKAKPFFWFGVLFLFYSFFIPIKLYYVIFGCVFLIFSIILKAFGKE